MDKVIQTLEEEMKLAARNLEFERAAELRDRIRSLRLKELEAAR
jgi:excinuclease ABC subunit B